MSPAKPDVRSTSDVNGWSIPASSGLRANRRSCASSRPSGTAIANRPFPSNTSPVTTPPAVGSANQIRPDSKLHVCPSTIQCSPPAGTVTGSRRYCQR